MPSEEEADKYNSMAEKYSKKDGHRPRPPLSMMYRTQRSRSTDTEVKRGFVLQPDLKTERELSVARNGNLTSVGQSRRRVSRLVQKFERYNSEENLALNTSSKTLPSPVPSHTIVRKSLGKTLPAPVVQQNKPIAPVSKFVPTRQQSPPSTEFRIKSITHKTSDSILTNNNKTDSQDQTTDRKNLPNDFRNSSPSMIPLSVHSSLSSEELPILQSTNIINRPIQNLSTSSGSDDDSSDTSPIEVKDLNVNQETNLFKPFEEVYKTERTYVKKLRVLCYELSSQVKETCEKDKNLIKTFKVTYKPLQKTLEKLYKFHSGVILPNIEQCKTGHRTNNMWTIFQDHFQTIEELYKAYYITYDENQHELDRVCRDNPLINKAMLNCQVYLENLYPINELNCANQRLLRYILLIKTYMKHLNENSPEYEQTRFIHDELNRIASRCEDHLAVSPSQLKKLKSRFDNKPECFENQQLIWHGLLKKQSPRRRNGIGQLYIILFSDCILVCEESGNKLAMKRQLLIENITVDIIEARRLPPPFHSNYGQQFSVITYPFRLNAIEKSYEFLVDKEQDREKWMNKIRQANEDFTRRHSDVEVRQSCPRSDDEQFGIRAPPWVNDTDVTRCQNCHNRFGSKIISGRRHHCRSCGRCVCSSCSTKNLILKYCADKGEVRVCDICVIKNPLTSTKTLRNPNTTILFGDFHYISSNSIVWIDLQEDHQLHIYGAKLDQIEDFSINLTELRELTFIEKTRTFVLNTNDKLYKFTIELNHQIIFQENDYIDKTVKNTNNKSIFYANVWHEAMKSARSKTVPSWYTRKRVSADSGIITVE